MLLPYIALLSGKHTLNPATTYGNAWLPYVCMKRAAMFCLTELSNNSL